MLTVPVQAKRLALVMGNDNYVSVSKLQKAGNDADTMARELRSAGFAVTSYKDLNYRAMLKAIDAFAESITFGDEVVVFYAGHGVQIKTGAYLLPVDIEAENESQVERTSYGLNDLTERLAEAKPAFTLVMVDACRDNPMKVKGRAVGNARGLNALEPPKGQMVVYSASRGQQALDRLSDNDSNPNGVFTREFITRMRTPGVKIDDLMRDVQDSVESLAKSVRHEQRPAVYNEARGNFYFYGPTTVQIQQGGGEAEERAWAASETANTASAYQMYLDAYPKGKYVVAAKIKLESFKQTPEQSSSETEAGLWAEVKATGTREYLETYIEQYPKGKYVALARLELKKLDDAEKAKAAKLALEAEQAKQREEQRAEQAAWDEAQKGNTANSYSAYLKKYPSGRFAAQARVASQAENERIAAAIRAEEERLKAEKAKKAEEVRLVNEEVKRAAEERARVDASKKAEEDRLAAEVKKAGTSEGAPNIADQPRNGLLIMVTEDGSTFFAQSSEKAEFDNAKAVFKRANYSGARKQFLEFLLRYPQSGYVPAARFWKGSAEFVLGDYEVALLTLRPLQIDAPKYRNTPEAMLAIANCYSELKDPQAARKTLEELVEQYERTEAASVARDRLAKLR
jgi:tol-pal system protein YbgF